MTLKIYVRVTKCNIRKMAHQYGTNKSINVISRIFAQALIVTEILTFQIVYLENDVTGQNIPGQNIPGQNITEQNIPGQIYPDKIYRTKYIRTIPTG